MIELAQIERYHPSKPRVVKRSILKLIFRALLLDKGEDVFYIQVGANDGILDDPIQSIAAENRWGGLLVEPHPIYFSELEGNLENRSTTQALNIGIATEEGTMPLFHISENAQERYPKWMKGCASLDYVRMERAIEKAEKETGHNLRAHGDIAQVDVPLKRLDQVLEDQGIIHADVIVIDVEGRELNVLNSFDHSTLGAAVMMVECNGPNIRQEAEYVAIMAKGGYQVFRFHDDLVAIHPERLKIPLTDVQHWVSIPRLDAS